MTTDPREAPAFTDDDMARFERKFHPEPNSGCWLWSGGVSHYGHGKFWFRQKWAMAHRVYYEHVHGKIAAGLELDHLCRVPYCVNPKHLEPVTHRENVLRGASPFAARAKQTSCKRGHLFTTENTYVQPRGTRLCRACARIADRARRKRRRAALQSLFGGDDGK